MAYTLTTAEVAERLRSSMSCDISEIEGRKKEILKHLMWWSGCPTWDLYKNKVTGRISAHIINNNFKSENELPL